VKKYKLTNKKIQTACDKTLYRIKALVDVGCYVKAGELGGFVEKEANLSHDGDAWVSGDAKVSDDAEVFGNAWVRDNAKIFGDAQVYGNAEVFDNAQVFGNAKVFGKAWVVDTVEIYGDACVFGKAKIFGDARVFGKAIVYGDAKVYGNARVRDNARIYGDAQVYGKAQVTFGAVLGSRARIGDTTAYCCMHPVGSRDDCVTFYRTRDGIRVICGCFEGTLKSFSKRVEKVHGDNQFAQEYRQCIDFATTKLLRKDHPTPTPTATIKRKNA